MSEGYRRLWPDEERRLRGTARNACTCTEEEQAGTSHAVMRFGLDELLYDIENCGYIEGHIMKDEDEHARHMTTDIGQEGNVDRVRRVLDRCHAEAVEMLYCYTKHAVVTEAPARHWHNVLLPMVEYQIHLNLPEDFSHTTVDLLEKWIHEYMVASVMSDWLSITNVQKSEVWGAKAEHAREEIEALKNQRRGVLRRPLHPF